VNLLGVGLVYAGFVTALAGVISMLRPLAFLGIHTRGQGLAVAACSLLLVAAGWLLPARASRAAAAATRLDELVPAWQFDERHRVVIRAPRQRIYSAIKEVTAREILFFRALTWIRRFGRPLPEGILNAPESKPLLELAAQTSFLLLAEDAEREIVLGSLVIAAPRWRPDGELTPEAWKTLSAPGFAKAAINFRVEDAGPGAFTVTTETRVFATDPATCRRFAAYWRVIYPGSSLIRAMWLRAIRLRAEQPAA
jgi:hypothetical protein